MKIKFINHACIQIFTKDYSMLVDPWFSGKVFNSSWELLKETDESTLDLSGLKYIFVSHEHPDHLNFDTLKRIYQIKSDLTFIFPFRKDNTIKKVIEKIGFNFHFIKQNDEKYKIDEINFVKYFSNDNEGDHTIIFSIDNKVIVNQNDDYTDEISIRRINQEFPNIDILFTQFSLAGYYGNSDDPLSIKKDGHDFHLNRVIEYQQKFNAPIVVPFASYVYFCKETNKYLNDYKVKPNEVFEALGNDICQLVYYGDEIFFNDEYKNRNSNNLNKLNKLFELKDLKYSKSILISDNQIIEMIDKKLSDMSLFKKIRTLTDNFKFLNLIKGFYKLFLLSKPLNILISDTNKNLRIDFLNNTSHISESSKENYDFKIPSEELLYMFKFPWGSDTANITATVDYYSKRSFYFFEFLLRYYHIHGAKFF